MHRSYLAVYKGTIASIVDGKQHPHTKPITLSSSMFTTALTALTLTLGVSTVFAQTPAQGPLNCPDPQKVNGNTLFPYWIVPVQWSNPNTAFGTKGTIDVLPGQDIVVQYRIPRDLPHGDCSFQIGLPAGPGYSLTGGSKKFRAAKLDNPLTDLTTATYASLGNLDSLQYATFVLSRDVPNLQVIFPKENCQPDADVAYIIRSLDDSALSVFENRACPATGAFIIWDNTLTSA